MRPRLYMFEPLERFARITITGMLLCLIQKCLSKPTITPPLPPPSLPYQPPHFLTPKWSGQTSSSLFVFSEAQLNSSVFLDKYHPRWKLWGCVYKSFVWPSLLWRSASIFWGTLKRCDEVGAACAALQLGMAGIVVRTSKCLLVMLRPDVGLTSLC